MNRLSIQARARILQCLVEGNIKGVVCGNPDKRHVSTSYVDART